jgi:hypothetical protein
MKLLNWTAVLTIAVLAATPAALAADASLSECIQLSKQVSTALESAQPGSNTDSAKTEAQAGRAYCASSMYAQGVAHYSKALQLLGKA